MSTTSREDIGATYSVSVGLSSYFTPEQGIRSSLVASGAPERMAEIEAEIFRILTDVAGGDVTAEEFANRGCRRPLRLRRAREMQI